MLVIIEDILHHPHKSILAQPIVLIYRIGRLEAGITETVFAVIVALLILSIF